jgi:hypothetical protein
MDATLTVTDVGRPPDDHGWWRKHVTAQNALTLTMVLFLAGQYWERQAHTNSSLADKLKAVEIRLLASELAQENAAALQQQTYVRRDVIEERLKAMEGQLADIREALRIRGPK